MPYSLKQRNGYISIESVILVGFMIALGAYAISRFYLIGQEKTDDALENVQKMMLTVDNN